MKQIFLLASSDAKWLTNKREEVVDQFVPKEMRDENLREIFCTEKVRAQNLGDILPDVVGELSTIPFLPDSRRVLVVHDLPELLAGGKKSAKARAAAAKGKAKETRRMTPLESFIAFVQRDLPSTNNILIFSTLIEYDRGAYFDEKGAFVQFLRESPLAEIPKPPKREQDPLFGLVDAMLDRDAVKCVTLFRSIYNPDSRARIFRKLLETARFLLQAKVLGKLQDSGASAIRIQAYLPEERTLNFLQQPDFVQKKIRAASARFQVRELMRSMDRLLEINENLVPLQNALYVPDVQLMLETFLMEFCAMRA
jgi:hypothetical protein